MWYQQPWGHKDLSLPLPGSALEQGSGLAHSSNRGNGNGRGHGECLGTPSCVGVQSHGATFITVPMGIMSLTRSSQASRA